MLAGQPARNPRSHPSRQHFHAWMINSSAQLRARGNVAAVRLQRGVLCVVLKTQQSRAVRLWGAEHSSEVLHFQHSCQSWVYCSILALSDLATCISCKVVAPWSSSFDSKYTLCGPERAVCLLQSPPAERVEVISPGRIAHMQAHFIHTIACTWSPVNVHS